MTDPTSGVNTTGGFSITIKGGEGITQALKRHFTDTKLFDSGKDGITIKEYKNAISILDEIQENRTKNKGASIFKGDKHIVHEGNTIKFTKAEEEKIMNAMNIKDKISDASPDEYEVQKGDSYWKIAKEQLPENAKDSEIQSKVKELQAINKSKGLHPNTKIKISENVSDSKIIKNKNGEIEQANYYKKDGSVTMKFLKNNSEMENKTDSSLSWAVGRIMYEDVGSYIDPTVLANSNILENLAKKNNIEDIDNVPKGTVIELSAKEIKEMVEQYKKSDKSTDEAKEQFSQKYKNNTVLNNPENMEYHHGLGFSKGNDYLQADNLTEFVKNKYGSDDTNLSNYAIQRIVNDIAKVNDISPDNINESKEFYAPKKELLEGIIKEYNQYSQDVERYEKTKKNWGKLGLWITGQDQFPTRP